jgi:hypothetical protein
VRQLVNIAERAVLQNAARAGTITSLLMADNEATGPTMTTEGKPLKEYVEAFERMLIDNTMRRHKGSIAAVMDELCLPRRTLNEKMAKYGLSRGDYLGLMREPVPRTMQMMRLHGEGFPAARIGRSSASRDARSPAARVTRPRVPNRPKQSHRRFPTFALPGPDEPLAAGRRFQPAARQRDVRTIGAKLGLRDLVTGSGHQKTRARQSLHQAATPRELPAAARDGVRVSRFDVPRARRVGPSAKWILDLAPVECRRCGFPRGKRAEKPGFSSRKTRVFRPLGPIRRGQSGPELPLPFRASAP